MSTFPTSRTAVARLANVARMIRGEEGATATTLAAKLGTSTKTIHRDLVFLRQELGHDLEYEPVKHVWTYRKLPLCFLL